MEKTWLRSTPAEIIEKGDRDAKELILRMDLVDGWKSSAIADYFKLEDSLRLRSNFCNDMTFFGRHAIVIDKIILGDVLPSLKSTGHDRNIRILDVGVGGSEKPTEPYEISGIFGYNSYKPKITVIDCNELPLNELMSIKKVSVDTSKYPYCSFGLEKKMAIFAYAARIAKGLGTRLTGDMDSFAFSVPKKFRSTFDAHKEDITMWKPSGSELGKFTFAIALNVFCYLGGNESKTLAFINMLDSLEHGGFIMLSSDHANMAFLESPLMQNKLGYSVTASKGSGYREYYYLLFKKD